MEREDKNLKKMEWKEVIWYLENRLKFLEMKDIVSVVSGRDLRDTNVGLQEFTKLSSKERCGTWTIKGVYADCKIDGYYDRDNIVRFKDID